MKEVNSYKVSKSRGQNSKSIKLCWKHNHTVVGEMIGPGDGEATRDPASVFEIRVHSSNNIYRIYISCIYLYTYRKRYSPNKTNKQKIQVQLTTKNAIMQEGKNKQKNLQQEKDASLSYLQMSLASFYLPIKILFLFLIYLYSF